MTEKIDATIDTAIARGTIVGTEVIVMRDGATIYRRAAGHLDREADIAMPANAIYRLASVTKPIVAATALAMADKGLLDLHDPVTRYLPGFTPKLADGSVPEITIHHLLTHTAGLAYHYPADPLITNGLADTDIGLDEQIARIAAQPLLFAPGSAWSYSFAIDVLGGVLEKIAGGPLGDVVNTHLTGPLGLSETGFFVADPLRLAKPYADAEPRAIPMPDPYVTQNELGLPLPFSPGRIFNPRAFPSGGGGMAGTPDDLMVFFEALRTGGDGIIEPQTLAHAFGNRIGTVTGLGPGERFGYLGAVVADPVAARIPEGAGTVRWGGVYGHSWSIDPQNALTILAMTNTAVEGCTGAFPGDLRRAIYAH